MDASANENAKPQQPPVDATGAELGPDEEFASPEEEAAMEAAIASAQEIIHADRSGQIENVLASGRPLPDAIAEVAWHIVQSMHAKQQQDMEFWMNLAAVIIEELQGVASAMGIPDAEDYEVAEAAMYKLMQLHGTAVEGEEGIQDEAKSALANMAKDPEAMEMANYVAGGMKNPISAGVQEGLSG